MIALHRPFPVPATRSRSDPSLPNHQCMRRWVSPLLHNHTVGCWRLQNLCNRGHPAIRSLGSFWSPTLFRHWGLDPSKPRRALCIFLLNWRRPGPFQKWSLLHVLELCRIPAASMLLRLGWVRRWPGRLGRAPPRISLHKVWLWAI